MTKRFQAPFFVLVLLVTASAATLGIGRMLPAAAYILRPSFDPQWGLDIMVDTLLADNHEDFSLAINPTNSNNVLASYKYEDVNGPSVGYDQSTDAGRTWGGERFSGPWGA